MEGLSLNNILGEQEIDTLFTSPDEESQEENLQEKQSEEPKDTQEGTKEKEDNNTADVVDPEELFDDNESQNQQQESVGSERKEGKEKEDTTTDNDSGTSPNNFYSSIANAMAVDGIFPNLTEDVIKKAADAEAFSDLIEQEVNARLDDRQQRISKALENGVEPNDIKKYENTLSYISSITDAQISEEGDRGEQLRRNLIYQDFINKGMSPDKAQKLTERSIDAGNDIDDAKDALQSNREFFSNAYNTLLKDAEEKAAEEKQARSKQAAQLKDDILKGKQLMGDMDISSDVRKKAFDNITKPVYKDPETGDYLTAIQKYEMEHRTDFLKYAGLIYTLTDGFKDFNSFVKGKVKKEVRKGLKELEHTLNNTSRDQNGNLRMVANRKEDPNSYLDSGFKLDL